MIVSVVACAFVWQILNCVRGEADSALYFIFGMVAVLLGQGIPFKPHHNGQKILLQLCMMMMFILGNLYQSLIISSMTWSRDGIRLETFEELFDSGTEMFVSDTFYHILKNSNEFDDVLKRMEAIETFETKKLISSKKALIDRCDALEYLTKVYVDFDLGSHFYTLPASTMPFYEQLVLARSSPFYEKLQTMHNYVLESGIRQHWNYLQDREKSSEMYRNDLFITSEQYLLNLDDLYGVFYLLLGGFVISVFAFVLELIWSYLRHGVDYRKITKTIRKKCRSKKQTMHVRRIQVHPMEV